MLRVADAGAASQVHFPFPGARPAMLAGGMREALDLGLIRSCGVCNYNASQMESIHSELASAGIPLASNQVPPHM